MTQKSITESWYNYNLECAFKKIGRIIFKVSFEIYNIIRLTISFSLSLLFEMTQLKIIEVKAIAWKITLSFSKSEKLK